MEHYTHLLERFTTHEPFFPSKGMAFLKSKRVKSYIETKVVGSYTSLEKKVKDGQYPDMPTAIMAESAPDPMEGFSRLERATLKMFMRIPGTTPEFIVRLIYAEWHDMK